MIDWIDFKKLLIIGGLSGALVVGLGAFGAHALKAQLSESSLQTYQTGITYHFFHTILLLAIAALFHVYPSKWLKRGVLCFLMGIILFSGSLYLLAVRDLIGLTFYRWLGPITPIGGMFFILGWLSIGMAGMKYNSQKAAK